MQKRRLTLKEKFPRWQPGGGAMTARKLALWCAFTSLLRIAAVVLGRATCVPRLHDARLREALKISTAANGHPEVPVSLSYVNSPTDGLQLDMLSKDHGAGAA